jgi:hypothetical protein
MKHSTHFLTSSALAAFLNLSAPLEAVSQEQRGPQTPQDREFTQTLANGTLVPIDCHKLQKVADRPPALTVAFIAQYEPLDEQAVERLQPWQRQWLMASRNNPSTNPDQIRGMINHLAVHKITQDDIAAGYTQCLPYLK